MTSAVAPPLASPTMSRPSSAVPRPGSSSMASSITKPERSARASDDDGKTSVKVAIRIRPALKPSDPGYDLIPQRFQRSMVQHTSPTSLTVDSPQGRKPFIFDHVFGGDVQQDGVFDYIIPGIDAFLQGYNVSVMAYGQSGAGKSFTMGTSGPTEQNDRQLMGIVPRAAISLFAKLSGAPSPTTTTAAAAAAAGGAGGAAGGSGGASGLKAPQRYTSMSLAPGALNGQAGRADRDWQLKATYIEIYNEQLRDLLIPADTLPDMRPTPAIREDKGKILLTNLTQVEINSTDDLLNALNHGSTIRQTDATAINARSSRSHAIFSLNLVQKKVKSLDSSAPGTHTRNLSILSDVGGSGNGAGENVIVTDSKLHFVDLAGSERLKNTGASGDRAREGIAINAGLASLGKVISQLSSRNAGAHVSYRDSKLTRILQDSLGGSAITYLVACVTPAEFHLSETLNTVQYAERARNIRSKPQIQQIHDEGDKQALIDRLRAEIAFLREQIKVAQQQQQSGANGDRIDEREAELREHLHAAQESYSALSKRHAKLIAEISKAGDAAAAAADHSNAAGGTPAERIERANSMNKVIDQVVSEYEETISTLQEQVGLQKGVLDGNEKRLLEQESRINYVEKVNTQLQARAQKFMDRESSLDSYVRDLEARLDGRNNTDDRQSEIISELRKQINRLRETEAQSEDYIANLEERLAEAEQDMEMMNREINSLTSVVERQRSVARLDSLMMELNNIQKKGEAALASEILVRTANGHIARDAAGSSGSGSSGSNKGEADKEEEEERHIPSAADEETRELAVKTPIPDSLDDDLASSVISSSASSSRPNLTIDATKANGEQQPAHSPSQMQFIEEKLDSVNQELVALRVEHEATVTEYDMLADKYQEALRALAAMQRAADADTSVEDPRGPFLAGARVGELKKEEQFSSSRGPSSELSSAAASPTVNDESDRQTELADSEAAQIRSTPATSISSSMFRPLSDISENGVNLRSSGNQNMTFKEVEQLKNLNAQKDAHVETLAGELEAVKADHDRALETIATLKNEVSRAKAGSPASPTNFVRRKSGHNVLGTDRINRAFVSLQNIAADHLEEKPDVRENIQLQVNALSSEMQNRSDRIEALEGEVTNAKKELESKIKIISGLTRERSSIITTSPVDVSIVSSLRDQLVQNENHINALQEQLGQRESELGKEIRTLKLALEEAEGAPRGSSDLSAAKATPNVLSASEREVDGVDGGDDDAETSRVRGENRSLRAAIKDLEATLSSVDKLRKDKTSEAEDHSRAAAAATAALEVERQKMTDELIQQKHTIEAHATRFDALQQAYEGLQLELTEHSGLSEASIAQLENHRSQIDQLEQHLQSQYDAIEEYKETIEEMARSHASQLDEMQQLIQQHELEASRDIPDGEEGMYELRKRLEQSETARAQADNTLREVQSKIETLSSLERQLKQENGHLRGENDRTSRLIQDLEGQLSHSYEDNRQSATRLSSIRQTSQQEVAEARAVAVKAQQEVAELQARLQLLERAGTPSQVEMPERANSLASRKSIGISALPSPPPAIPLPPLPANAPQSPMVATFGADGRPKSPPTSTALATKRDSATQATIQEQEARIRTAEKHLNAEKQLTATLEEALVDLEAQGEKVKKEAENWRKRAQQVEAEMTQMKQERSARQRDSQQLMEAERNKRVEAERRLAESMNLVNKKKKKGGGLNCF